MFSDDDIASEYREAITHLGDTYVRAYQSLGYAPAVITRKVWPKKPERVRRRIGRDRERQKIANRAWHTKRRELGLRSVCGRRMPTGDSKWAHAECARARKLKYRAMAGRRQKALAWRRRLNLEPALIADGRQPQ